VVVRVFFLLSLQWRLKEREQEYKQVVDLALVFVAMTLVPLTTFFVLSNLSDCACASGGELCYVEFAFCILVVPLSAFFLFNYCFFFLSHYSEGDEFR